MGSCSFEAIGKILVIENEARRMACASLLQCSGLGPDRIVTAERLSTGLMALARERIDVVVLDLTLADSTGPMTLRKLRLHEPHSAVVALGEDADGLAAARAIADGAETYLPKQAIDGPGLVHAVQVAAQHRRNLRALHQEIATLRSRASQYAQALQLSEQRLAALCDLVPMAVFHTDARCQCVSVGGAWQSITGLPPQAMLGRAWLRLLPPDDRRRLLRRWLDARAAREPFRVEHGIEHADGRPLWLLIDARPLQDADGQFCGFLGTISDLTAHHEAERAAARQQHALEAEQLARWRLEAELAQARRAAAEAGPGHSELLARWETARDTNRRRTRKLIAGLRRACQELAEETEERRRAEAMLSQLHDKLDAQVQQRTSELSKANRALRAQVDQLSDRHHDALRRLEQRMDNALSHIRDSTGVLVDQLSRQWSEKQSLLLRELTVLTDRVQKKRVKKRATAACAADRAERPHV